MSRTVKKFRAWDDDKNEMIYDVGLDVVGLMQFTGMVDRDGVDVYEGDILRVSGPPYFDGDILRYVAVVEFLEFAFCRVLRSVGAGFNVLDGATLPLRPLSGQDDFGVMHNAYFSPDFGIFTS